MVEMWRMQAEPTQLRLTTPLFSPLFVAKPQIGNRTPSFRYYPPDCQVRYSKDNFGSRRSSMFFFFSLRRFLDENKVNLQKNYTSSASILSLWSTALAPCSAVALFVALSSFEENDYCYHRPAALTSLHPLIRPPLRQLFHRKKYRGIPLAPLDPSFSFRTFNPSLLFQGQDWEGKKQRAENPFSISPRLDANDFFPPTSLPSPRSFGYISVYD